MYFKDSAKEFDGAKWEVATIPIGRKSFTLDEP